MPLRSLNLGGLVLGFDWVVVALAAEMVVNSASSRQTGWLVSTEWTRRKNIAAR